MHILYIHQYFSTPNGQATTAAYDFVRRWVRAGHRVTVLTSTARLATADVGGPVDGRACHRFRVDGVDVLALRVGYGQGMGVARRAWAFLAFMTLSTWHAMWLAGVDVVYASSSPLTIGVPAMILRRVRRTPFVFEVRDAWPAVPIQMGVLRNRFLIWAARKLERIIYRQAGKIVAVSPGMADLVRESAPEGKPVVTIPNNSDTQSFRPDVDGSRVRAQRGWNGKFVCAHTGAMGRVNGLDVVLRAARRLRDRPELVFALIGGGSEKRRLADEARRLELTNVQILDGVPQHEMPATLAAADLCLMTVAPVPILEHNSANKFFDYLSAGRPVLLNYGGWQREALESYGAGLGCRMGDDEEFFARLRELTGDPDRLKRMGAHARRLALERFPCDRLAADALAAVVSVAS